MSKKKKVNDNKNKLVKSINKNVRSSTRKLNPILKGLVGKKVDIALRNLDFSDKRIAKDIKKTISSAVSNAENNFGCDVDDLVISTIYIDEAPTFKRFRARAKGRGARILKRNCHITVAVSDEQKS